MVRLLMSLDVTSRDVSFLSAIFGGMLSFFYGGLNQLLIFLLFCMIVDYFTGILASLKEKKGLNSNVGFWGLAKKFLMLIIIALLHRADIVLETSFLMDGALFFYIANELLSITENYGRLGLPMPNQVKEVIAILKNKNNDKGGEKSNEQANSNH